MPKKRNSAKKSTQNIQSIGCPHLHTHTLPQLEIDVCFNCLIIYYSDYEYRKIEDSKEASQSIRVLKTYLEDIKVTAQVNRFHIQHKSFFDELNMYFSDLDLLNKRLGVAIQQNSYQEFLTIKEESLKLKQKLETSQVMIVYSRYRAQSLLERRINEITNTEYILNANKPKSKNNEDASKQEVMITPKEETKDTPKDDYTILMENYAIEYSEVVLKVQHLKNEKSDLESRVLQLDTTNKDLESKFKSSEEAYNEAEERCSKLKTEVDDINKKHIEDEKKIDILKEEVKNCIKEYEERKLAIWNEYRTSIAELYKTKVGKTLAANDEDIELELNLGTQSHLDMLNSLKYIRLPNLKKIDICYPTEKAQELFRFLFCSLPDSLPIISINLNSGGLTNPEFLLKGLLRIGSSATKEIYLRYINFTKDNFEQFVKSCTKAEKLCLTCSNFNFDSELDFSGPSYNISYLGFKDSTSHSNSWSTKPERFGNIVKAIALSGLKESLKTINIQKAGLTIDQVKEMLITNKIEHINVVQETKEPH